LRSGWVIFGTRITEKNISGEGPFPAILSLGTGLRPCPPS